MGSGIYSIGVSALNNAQLGLATTGHNIANANTDGYNRQRIVQSTNIPTLTGSGYLGTGAYVSTIERIYSGFLARQVTTAQTTLSALDAYAAAIGELNTLLSDRNAGLESALEGFFAGVNQVAANPTSLTTRQTMVSGAQSLVARFQTLNDQLNEQYKNVNSQIQGYVGTINSFGQQIAKINKQIVDAEAISGQPPNDLYDQRDQMIAELNKLIGTQTSINTNGSVNVFFGNGQPLVVGVAATTLVAMPASGDPTRLTVGIVNVGGTQELPESLLTGGALSGVLQYRSETLDAASNSLGRIAVSMAITFNAQHALGQDLLGRIDGDTGFVADFFNLGTPHVVANSNNPPGAATVTASFLPPSYNGEDSTFYTNLTTSDYRLDYDGTTLTLTRLSDKVSWSGATIAALNTAIDASPQGSQGFSIAAGGAMLAGSSYLIQPTRNVASTIAVNPTIAADVRQIAVATPIIASAGTANTGTATISPGSVMTGYTPPAAGAPVTLAYANGDLTGFSSYPVTVTVNGVDTTYAAGPVPYTNGATYSFAGMNFTISGTPRNGDTFEIARNSNGVSDNRNALLLAKMQTGKTMAGHTATFSTAYSQLVSDAGNKGAEIQTVQTAQQTVLDSAVSARNSISGVNLDEEAVNLIQYQQSYQAAARMLEIASRLFDSILAIGA
ncbi:MAG: flagellar hook-associated protein FlgK [Candidatus Accumulibacter sp.]|jgi:flagellar hook-associated protein 1 FlgK|nr:flagellar hook-associated protein FlgK [Accumulibacter sp.]